jgi:hypothetical protein
MTYCKAQREACINVLCYTKHYQNKIYVYFKDLLRTS